MDLDLKRLRQVVAIAEERNFAEAARKLALSQPALSRSLQVLETDRGGRLFDRGRGGVTPTPLGERMLAHARSLLRQAEEARRDIDLVLGCEAGTLRIGAGPYPASISIGLAVARLIERHPGLEITVHVDDAESLTRQVLEAEVDLAVAELTWTSVSDRLNVVTLPKHPASFFCRAIHPLAQSRTLTLDDIGTFPLVATPLPERVWHLLRRAGPGAVASHRAQGSAPRPPIQVNSFELIRRIVLESDAVGLATASQISDDVQAGLLQTLDLVVPGLESNYGVIILAGRTPSPAAEAFVEILRQVEAEVQAA
jgi:DNA-binding transcriptional LysR family regulator